MPITRFVLVAVILALSACSSGGSSTVEPSSVAANPTPTVQPSPVAANPTPTVQPSPVAANPSPTVQPSPVVENPTPTVQPSPVAENPTAPVPPVAAAGQCQNPYYPVVQGATWQYQISGASSDTFVRTITQVREDGFDDQDVFSSGATRQGSWQCQQGNLIGLSAGSNPSVALSDQMNFTFTVESNTGISFPADPQPGAEWTQTIVYGGQSDIGGTTVALRNTMQLSCKAIGVERVSVPVGNLEALRVDCTTRFDISFAGATALSTTTTGSAWYASGVGLVKSRDSSDTGVTEIVLLSYSIP